MLRSDPPVAGGGGSRGKRASFFGRGSNMDPHSWGGGAKGKAVPMVLSFKGLQGETRGCIWLLAQDSVGGKKGGGA